MQKIRISGGIYRAEKVQAVNGGIEVANRPGLGVTPESFMREYLGSESGA